MARIIRQTTIWQQLERELPPGLEEVQEFLRCLSEFDEELVRKLELKRGHGRADHPVRAMWNLLATSLYLRDRRFSDLLGELRRNSDLARLLGFREIGPNRYDLPSDSALSLFHVKLKENYLEQVQAVFHRTVEALGSEHPEFGKHTALDSSDVRSHARPARKPRATEEEGKKDETETGETGEKKSESSDPEASWSVKTKRWKDNQGKKREEKKCTFGYKLVGVTDTTIPALCAVDVVTASASDQNLAVPLIDASRDNLRDSRMKTVAMDKGFDSEENVVEAHSRGVAAIVPVREVPEKLESQPREDREVPLSRGSNVVYDRYSGEVACYEAAANANEEPTRRPMTYAGFESGRDAHKFRCPLGGAAATACRSFGSCAAGPSGSQGRQVRIPMKTDPRRFGPVYPRSKRWKRLYNGRSAIERINSYLKEVLQLENHCLRGKSAIKLRVLLASITLNVRTLTALRRQAAVAKAA
jgi:hypothetical protein